jgi:predicted nucleic acid-binding protein
MFLVDTDVISEQRKDDKANAGVQAFFHNASRDNTALYLSVITIGELRQGVERIRHRGDGPQADRLWGRLRVPHPENPLDKQIAATALLYELVVVTRNIEHYERTGVRLMNPFT